MRSFWVGLAVFFVLLASLRITFSASGGSQWPSRPPLQHADVPRQEVPEQDIVTGYGDTAASARDRALEKAQERVQELLGERLGNSSWSPPRQLLDPEYLTRHQVLRSLGDPVAGPQVDPERMTLVARYQVHLTPDYVRSVVQVSRQKLALRVLAGLFGLLLVAVGYLRLEELTRGYATRLLRLGAVVVVSLIGVGLWLSV